MLGGSVGAVGGCRRLESSVVFVLDVGEVRADVGGLVGVGVLVFAIAAESSSIRVRQLVKQPIEF